MKNLFNINVNFSSSKFIFFVYSRKQRKHQTKIFIHSKLLCQITNIHILHILRKRIRINILISKSKLRKFTCTCFSMNFFSTSRKPTIFHCRVTTQKTKKKIVNIKSRCYFIFVFSISFTVVLCKYTGAFILWNSWNKNTSRSTKNANALISNKNQI